MTASARLLTSVEPDQRERFSELAAAQGVSASRCLQVSYIGRSSRIPKRK